MEGRDFVTDEEIIRLHLCGVKMFPEHMMVNQKRDEVATDGTEHKPEAEDPARGARPVGTPNRRSGLG